MKLWAIVRSGGKIKKDALYTADFTRPLSDADLHSALKALCYELDLACPVVLSKHLRDMASFSRAAFLPGDFIEPVDFDKLEIEIIPEKKPK